MGRSHSDKERRRAERLEPLPSGDKALALARIKRKEGRILNADERHAIKMQGPVGNALKLCELIRAKATSAEDRAAHIDEVLTSFQPDWEKYCRSPQTSRVIQSCMKNGSTEQVRIAYEMCIPSFSTLCGDPFAAFVMCSIIRHASHIVFSQICEALGSIGAQVIDSKPGIFVVDTALTSDYCSARQRSELICACVGTKEELKRLEGYPNLLEMPKSLVPRIVERCDKILAKGRMDCELVHALTLVGVSVSDDKTWHKEVYDILRPSIVQLSTASHPGSILAAQIFVYLPPKERKVVMGELSDNVVAIAGNKNGAPFLSAVFDHQLDVQVLHKFLVSRLIESVTELIQPPLYRNFSKLLQRIVTRDLKKKLVCVPEIWRRSYPFINDESTAIRHSKIAATLIPPVITALMTLDDSQVSSLGVRVLVKELLANPIESTDMLGSEWSMPNSFTEWAESSVKRKKDE
jgi:pumilio family protein 6